MMVRRARTLEAPRQGDGWIFLDWKDPVDGGKIAAYKIERRKRRQQGDGEDGEVDEDAKDAQDNENDNDRESDEEE